MDALVFAVFRFHGEAAIEVMRHVTTQDNPFKSMTLETKALIIVSEFEAKRMPIFQLRHILNEIIIGPDELRAVVDLVENDLRAGGFPAAQVEEFLTQLLQPPEDQQQKRMSTTRRLRSPFTRSFDKMSPPVPGAPVVNQTPISPLPAVPPPVKGRPEVMRPRTEKPMGPPPPPGVPFSPSRRTLPSVPTPMPTPPIPANPAPPNLPLAGDRQTRSFSASRKPFKGSRPTAARMAGRDAPDIQFGASLTSFVPPPDDEDGTGGAPLILVADDDKRVRMVQKIRLEDAGFDIMEAADGNEAWRRIQGGQIDLAVLDMKMPGLHGLEVLTRIVDSGLQLPVVICSAYDQLKDEFIVATYPRLKYLVKPVSPDTLLKAVRELIGSPK